METTLRKPIPLGVYLIATFYLFGGLVLLLGTPTGLVDARMAIARTHGLPGLASTAFVLMVALLALVLSYGLISLSRWGYILTIAYALCLVVISLVLGALDFPLRGEEQAQIFFGNFLWSLLVAVYLFLARRHFRSNA